MSYPTLTIDTLNSEQVPLLEKRLQMPAHELIELGAVLTPIPSNSIPTEYSITFDKNADRQKLKEIVDIESDYTVKIAASDLRDDEGGFHP